MKKYLPLLTCLSLMVTVALAFSDSVDPSKLFIVDSSANAFVIQTYNRIFVGTWLEIRGKDVQGAQTITITDIPPFAPQEVRLVVKHQPFVVKKGDVWEITFPEVKP